MRSLLFAFLMAACSSASQDDGDATPGTDAGDFDAGIVIPAELDDDFGDPASLSEWTVLDSTRHAILDIDSTTPGRLTIVPRADSAWFEDGKGPFMFKLVSGDFAVRTAVIAGNSASPDDAPTMEFNSAGFVVRDPASRPGGNENWLMLNLGFQDGRVGSEGKTTVNSRSTLFITDGSHRGELILCRVGSQFSMFRKLEGESSFTETNRFDRGDLPITLQVGLVANGYGASPNLHAVFDYVRFRVPASEGDCRE